MSMFAAEVWTYWLAPPLFAAAVMLVVATAVGYYRKVAVPYFLAEQQRRLQLTASADESKQPVERLLESQSGEQMPLAA
ncbi:MAG: hypothetical protein M3N28_01105 [Actinomycetota bacterium]|nr:hypothetical protein [Actinomycetota bacterium]